MSGAFRTQVAVIGSGPGGAITAALLAEAGREVMLVEEGPALPLESAPAFSLEEMRQKYRNAGLTLALGGPKIQYAEARCVGGGSEINSGLYHRTPPNVLEDWRRLYQVRSIDETIMRPHFEAVERDLSVGLSCGGAPEASLRLHEGARRLGWRSAEIPRWHRRDPGVGGRQSMSRTYIPRALGAGARLVAATRARRLRRGGIGWGIECEATDAGGWSGLIEAETVFVCGGAIQTPALLRRSGLGRHVGRSLRLHPMIKFTAEFEGEVNTPDMGVPMHQVKEFAPRVSFGCSISTPPFLALALLDHGIEPAELAGRWRRMATYYAATTSDGRGSITPLPGLRDPLVRYGLFPSDLRELAAALEHLARLLFAGGAVALYPSITGGPVLRTPGDVGRLGEAVTRGRTNLMTVHLFSSCPMGEDLKSCSADSFGRVHGERGLFINDASLLCTPPGVNPQGSIMAVARRNVMRFLGTD